MDEKNVVNLKAKKKEWEWLAASDKFWLAFTPKLFEWIGWVAALAGVKYVYAKSSSFIIGFMVWLCALGMIMYFYAYFSRIEILGFSFLKSERWSRLLSVAMTSALAGLAIFIASVASDIFVSSQ
ncbi:MAG: hypothetical protein ACOY3E_00650 [Pseudomonadota bacterium]